MVFDGFGIHAKLVGSAVPDPQTGQVTVYFEDLPQVPFEDFDIHLFASDRGLMATPTRCTIYTSSAASSPGTKRSRTQNSVQHFSLDAGPARRRLPGPGPAVPPAPRGRDLEPDGRRVLQLPPQARPRRRRPVPRRPQLQDAARLHRRPARHHLLPGSARSSPPPRDLGRAELAAPSCPASSQIGTTNVAAGPGGHPFHAIGKMYLAGRSRARRSSLAAITPALAGPYDYGVVVVRVALHVDPQHRAGVGASRTRSLSIIGGVPIRMRSIQVNIDKPNFTINPTNCSPILGRHPGDRRPGHGRRLLLLLQCGQLRCAAVQAEA